MGFLSSGCVEISLLRFCVHEDKAKSRRDSFHSTHGFAMACHSPSNSHEQRTCFRQITAFMYLDTVAIVTSTEQPNAQMTRDGCRQVHRRLVPLHGFVSLPVHDSRHYAQTTAMPTPCKNRWPNACKHACPAGVKEHALRAQSCVPSLFTC